MTDRGAAEAASGVPAPTAAAVLAVPSDAWAWWLPRIRASLHELADAEVTVVVRRLRAAPTSRLAGGRVRRELAELLASGGPLWRELVARTEGAGDVPDPVAALLEGRATSPGSAAPPARPRGQRRDGEEAEASDPQLERTRAQLRKAREERDLARRRAEAAEARAQALLRDLDAAREALEAATAELEAVRGQLAGTEERERRAVDRERRRRDRELARLEGELAAARRAEEQRRAADRRAAETRAATRTGTTARPARPAGGDGSGDGGSGRFVPGRPSRLPTGVVAGTTEAVELLLHRDRLVLVDGYNVTKQHRGDDDLAGQRAWLEQRLSALAARRGVRPVVVFDGAGTGPSGRPATSHRGVEVRFSPAGVTADDEVVLAVLATDEPVVVVTDDRELSARVRADGADVVGTGPFLWVAR